MLAVETGHRQSYDLITGSGDTFHFHASLGAYKKDFCFRIAATQRIGY